MDMENLKRVVKIRLLAGLIVYIIFVLALTVAACSGNTGSLKMVPPADQPTATADVRPSAIPEWEPGYAEQFPGCEKQVEGAVYPDALVVVLDGTLRRMDTDLAWKRNRDDHAGNDVWVVGGCR